MLQQVTEIFTPTLRVKNEEITSSITAVEKHSDSMA